MRNPLRRLARQRGHVDPVPETRARLATLTDYPWPDFCGGREWCDAELRPCSVCRGQCCACRHTERQQR